MCAELPVSSLLPTTRGFFVGGRRGTQPLDIGHAAALLVEKGLDMGSQASIAQADVKSYFDSLPLLKIMHWLLVLGVDLALLTAILRAQLLTTVILCIGRTESTIPFRGSGGLTGSLVALLLARIPIESTFLEMTDHLIPLGFKIDHFSLLAASWIDNIYTFGSGPSACTTAMDIIFKRLESV